MKKLPLLLFFVLIVLTAQADKPWDNGRLVVSDNHRFLQFANGTPFFYLGDTGWLLPEKLNREEAAYYLERCAAAGFNVVQVQVVNGVPAINAYGQMALDDGFNFKDVKKSGVYGYWDHLDYIVDEAARHGLYIGMVCIWGGLVKGGKMNVEQAKSYGAFLADRYGKRKNIIWIMGGDIQGDINADVWEALATSIKAKDKQHLMTFHPRGRHTSAEWFNDSSWLDFHMFQSGHRRYFQRMGDKDYPIVEGTEEDNWMYVDSTWKHKPIKPVIDGEPSYEDIPQGLHDGNEPRWTATDVRRYAYWSVFAGSCGHTYGHNAVMQFAKPGTVGAYFADGNAKPWYKAMDDDGYNQMKYLKSLMLTFPYFDRIADQTIVEDNGVRYERLVATRGTDYLMVYNHTGREMRLRLSAISGERKNVWWMDAADGHLVYLGQYANTVVTFRPHATHRPSADGVLIAVDASKSYLDTSQTAICSSEAFTRSQS